MQSGSNYLPDSQADTNQKQTRNTVIIHQKYTFQIYRGINEQVREEHATNIHNLSTSHEERLVAQAYFSYIEKI